MLPLAVALLVASGATAQQIMGTLTTSIPIYPSASSGASPSYGSSSALYTGQPSATYQSSAPQYTPPPTLAASQSAYYPQFTGGGYSSMDCGYGYAKDSSGKCTALSWVWDSWIMLFEPFYSISCSVQHWIMGLLRDCHHQSVRIMALSIITLLTVLFIANHSAINNTSRLSLRWLLLTLWQKQWLWLKRWRLFLLWSNPPRLLCSTRWLSRLQKHLMQEFV